MKLIERFWHDEAGFVLSSELMLIATIVVLSVVVGLSEIALAINSELKDVSSSFGSVNQGYNAGHHGSHRDRDSDRRGWDHEIGGVDPEAEYR